jgi:hypothetical protein
LNLNEKPAVLAAGQRCAAPSSAPSPAHRHLDAFANLSEGSAEHIATLDMDAWLATARSSPADSLTTHLFFFQPCVAPLSGTAKNQHEAARTSVALQIKLQSPVLTVGRAPCIILDRRTHRV